MPGYTRHRCSSMKHIPPGSLGGMCRMPGKSILLVEDEPLVRDLLAHNLRAEGYAVEAVPSFAEAWQRVTNRLYALVIADWRLPDGDGTQIADAAVERGMKTFVM